jgi:hypothetical protein
MFKKLGIKLPEKSGQLTHANKPSGFLALFLKCSKYFIISLLLGMFYPIFLYLS